jgi:hypothetical protein
MRPEAQTVEYCLANGAVLSYAYSPGSSILALIHDIVDQYVEQRGNASPTEIHIQPQVMYELWKCDLRTGSSSLRVLGYEDVRVSTPAGSLRVIVTPKLRWPIFYGTTDEYFNNEFDAILEKVLT